MTRRTDSDRLSGGLTARFRMTGWQAYAFGVIAMALAIALERYTWPVFSRAPYSPPFAAVYCTVALGTRRAAWLTILLGALFSPLLFPIPEPPLFLIGGTFIFVVVSAIAVHLIIGRRTAEVELRESERRLRQAQKMEAVGQLVAGVAHNFNNLLTITMGYADLLADKYQGDAEARLALEEIRKATSRGAALTRQLLAFSRQREAAGTWVDVNPALLDLKDLLVRLVREDVTLTIEAAATPARAQVDVQEFEQAILNLVINARDALPSGGHIWITVSNEVIDAPLAISDLTLQPGPYVCVQVRDDGVGMPPEVQAHLFEPFFTTKDVGKGTGLGLASIYGLARRHRGAIGIDSAPGQGTTVTLYFPSARRADGDAPGRSEPAGGSRRGLDTSPEQPN